MDAASPCRSPAPRCRAPPSPLVDREHAELLSLLLSPSFPLLQFPVQTLAVVRAHGRRRIAAGRSSPGWIEDHSELHRILLSFPTGGIKPRPPEPTHPSSTSQPRPPLAGPIPASPSPPSPSPTTLGVQGELLFLLASPAPFSSLSRRRSPSTITVAARHSAPGLDPGLTGHEAGWLGPVPGLDARPGPTGGRRLRPPPRPPSPAWAGQTPVPSGWCPACSPAWPAQGLPVCLFGFSF